MKNFQFGKNNKAQSAIEYIISYSWALAIIAIVLLVYLFTTFNNHNNTLSPSYCYISPQLPCYDLIISTNSLGTSAAIVFTNNLGKPIYFGKSTSFSISFGPSSQTYNGYCTPTTANPGVNVTCGVNIPGVTQQIGTELTPKFYILYNECVTPNCSSNSQNLLAITTSGSSLTYVYQYNSSSYKNIPVTPPPVIVYTLTTNSFPSNGGSVSPVSGSYDSGNTVTISETPASGYVFDKWSCSGNGCYSGKSSTKSIFIDANIVETANFIPMSSIVYTLTTNAVPSNGGTVSPVSGSYEDGNSVTISETPGTGYLFNGWSCSGTGCYSGQSQSNTIIISSNVVETANFILQSSIQYTLTTNAVPSNGGSVSPVSGNYAGGSLVDLTATPSSGYNFNGWSCSGTGCYSGGSSTNTITINANIIETANFGVKPPGYYGNVTEFICKTNDTYLYSNETADGYGISVFSDQYQNEVLNNLNEPMVSSNTDYNYAGAVKGGYVYELSQFKNSTLDLYSLAIINTSSETVVKKMLIDNSTILNDTQGTYFMQFNNSGALYIIMNGKAVAGPGGGGGGVYFLTISNADIQNALSSSQLFNKYTNIPLINITAPFNLPGGYYSNPNTFTETSYTGFKMLGKYAYVSTTTNLFVFNTSANNQLVKNLAVATLTSNGYFNTPSSGITNIESNGGYVFANINYIGIANYENNTDVLSSINTTNWEISNIIVYQSNIPAMGLLSNETSVDFILNNNFSKAYVMFGNQTLYTVTFNGLGNGYVSNVIQFAPYDGYHYYIYNTGENPLQFSANNKDLYAFGGYCGGTCGGGAITGYLVYNISTGQQTLPLGITASTLGGGGNYNIGGELQRICAPQNNYNIYYTGESGELGISSTAYNLNFGTLPLTYTGVNTLFQPTAILINNTQLYVGGYNNSNSDYYGLLATASTTNNLVESLSQGKLIYSYFTGSTYPMDAVIQPAQVPPIMGLSWPSGNYYTISPYGTYGITALGTISQVIPNEFTTSVGFSTAAYNGQAVGCTSSDCPFGNAYITAMGAIVPYSNYVSTTGAVCAAEANYGAASTPQVNLAGAVQKNGNVYVLSRQNDNNGGYSGTLLPSPGGMGASAAQAYFNNAYNTSMISVYSSGLDSTYASSAGTGDAGTFACNNPPSPNEFITYTYWSLTDPSLEATYKPSNSNTIIAPPIVTSSTTPNIYMLNFTNNGGILAFNTVTNTYTAIPLPGMVATYSGLCGSAYSTTTYSNYGTTMALSPNSTRLFVVYNTGDGGNPQIAVINTSTNKIISSITYMAGYSQNLNGFMVISPDGKYIYLSELGGNEVILSVSGLLQNSIYSVLESPIPTLDNLLPTAQSVGADEPGSGFSGQCGAQGLGQYGQEMYTQQIAITPNTQQKPT